MPNYQKFLRGQVWFFNENNNTIEDGVIFGDRPVLIISNDHNNRAQDTVTVLPLSNSKSGLVGLIGKYNFGTGGILCNQIKTVNKKRLTSYEYTLDNATMQEISNLLIKTLCLTEEELEAQKNIIVGLPQGQPLYKDVINNNSDFICVDEELEEIEVPKQTEENIPNVVKPIKTTVANKVKKTRKSTKRNHPNKKWDEEDKIAFIIDSNNMTAKELTVKYKLNINTIYGYRCKFLEEVKEFTFVKDYQNMNGTELVKKYGTNIQQLQKRYKEITTPNIKRAPLTLAK